MIFYLSGPNQWPDLDNFRPILEDYVKEMNTLGRRLMRLALCSAGVKYFSVLSAFDPATIWMRFTTHRSSKVARLTFPDRPRIRILAL